MKSITTSVVALVLAVCLAACGSVDDENTGTPVRGAELSASAGQMTSPSYQLSFQLGRSPQTTKTTGQTVAVEPATPIRTR